MLDGIEHNISEGSIDHTGMPHAAVCENGLAQAELPREEGKENPFGSRQREDEEELYSSA